MYTFVDTMYMLYIHIYIYIILDNLIQNLILIWYLYFFLPVPSHRLQLDKPSGEGVRVRTLARWASWGAEHAAKRYTANAVLSVRAIEVVKVECESNQMNYSEFVSCWPPAVTSPLATPVPHLVGAQRLSQTSHALLWPSHQPLHRYWERCHVCMQLFKVYGDDASFETYMSTRMYICSHICIWYVFDTVCVDSKHIYRKVAVRKRWLQDL